MSSAGAVDAALQFVEAKPELTRTRTVVWQDPMPSASAGAEMAGLDYMNSLVAGEIPPPPIAVLMCFAPVEVSAGQAIFEGRPGEEHYNPIGVVHGGYASTLLDSAMGCAVHTTLERGAAYTTLTLEVKMVRPLLRDTGIVRAKGTVVHRGRRQATVEGTLVAAESGKLLAHGTSSCMIL